MAYLSRWDIEQIAYRVAKDYASLTGQRYEDLERVVPEVLLGGLLGLRIGYERLSLDGSVLGITSFCEMEIGIFEGDREYGMAKLDGNTVLIEADLQGCDQTGRRNFTIMHEAGHRGGGHAADRERPSPPG